MKKQLQIFLILFMSGIGLVLSSCSDAPSPATVYSSAENYLNEIGFSGSVLVNKGNTVLLKRGFGLADRGAGIQNDPTLIYRIGSITKSFTSAAIVNLKRDGLIESFDQPISDFDDEFPKGDQITLHHLMTHHSGIRDYVGTAEAYAQANNHSFETDEIYEIITESINEDGLEFTPGDFFSYSNSNYFILGMLIEKLSGKTYQEYLQEKVYTPLNLTNTHKGWNEITGSDHAKGYHNGNQVEPYQMQIAFSAGEIESTISDLEKWGAAIMSSYFTAEEREAVLAAPIGQDGVNAPGAGWFTLNIEGQVVYHHGGDIQGFTSLLVLLPESHGIIILLSNEQDKGFERSQIMETLIKNEF